MVERENGSDLSSQGETAFIVNSNIKQVSLHHAPFNKPEWTKSESYPSGISFIFGLRCLRQIGELDLAEPRTRSASRTGYIGFVLIKTRSDRADAGGRVWQSHVGLVDI